MTSVEISDDGATVVSGGIDKTVRIFHVKEHGTSIVCTGHEDSVRDVRIVQSGTRVVSCSTAGILNIWDITSGDLMFTIMSGTTEHATCLDVVQRCGETMAAVSGVVGGVKINPPKKTKKAKTPKVSPKRKIKAPGEDFLCH